MKKLFTLLLLLIATISGATTYIVDINGAGNFKYIQIAINNSANGDTVKVWPGTYNEAVNLNKNLVLLGSGYENTIITSSNNPTITMSNGLIKWFRISSTGGNGININGGTIKNCVVNSCASNGVFSNSGTGFISNCVLLYNGVYGIRSESTGFLYVTNCISRSNSSYGFSGSNPWTYCYNCGDPRMNLSYSNGSACCTINNQGVIDTDPYFLPKEDYRLSSGSPSIDKGQPSLSDPDGSVSDMGYFGGPDCPIYPVVSEMTIQPDGTNFKITAKGRANY
jgi:hypothetical protein